MSITIKYIIFLTIIFRLVFWKNVMQKMINFIDIKMRVDIIL